jgi:flagellin
MEIPDFSIRRNLLSAEQRALLRNHVAVIKIGKNILAENIVRNLTRNATDLSTVFERLSSGQRINKASDDPAGLAIASDLQVRTRIINQGLRNVNDGISFLAIAEGGLESLTEIITRQKELAGQAANGTYSLKQRQALDNEARALTDEYNRIVATTTFNGINVFSAGDVVVQSGIGDVETTQIGIGNLFQQATAGGAGVGSGTFTIDASYSY